MSVNTFSKHNEKTLATLEGDLFIPKMVFMKHGRDLWLRKHLHLQVGAQDELVLFSVLPRFKSQ